MSLPATKYGKIIFVKYFWFIVIFLAILILLLGFVFLIKPKWDPLKKGGPLDLESYEKILTDEKKYLTKVKKMKQEYDELYQNKQDRLEKLNYVVGDTGDQAGLLMLIDTITRNFSFNIDNLAIVETQKDSATLGLSLTGGNYQVFKQFFQTIENSIRIMDIVSLQLSKGSTDTNLKIRSYFLE